MNQHRHSEMGNTKMESTTLTSEASVQPLTQHEIDRRIGAVAAQVLACPVDQVSALARAESTDLHPYWISPAELVDRMKPFMVLN